VKCVLESHKFPMKDAVRLKKWSHSFCTCASREGREPESKGPSYYAFKLVQAQAEYPDNPGGLGSQHLYVYSGCRRK